MFVVLAKHRSRSNAWSHEVARYIQNEIARPEAMKNSRARFRARGRQCVTTAICNQDLYTGERNFRPDFCTFYARQQPGGELSCHSIPKVSGANVTPAISQTLRAWSSHLFEGGRSAPSLPPGEKSHPEERARPASARDAMNGHRITLSRSISSNPDDRRQATCIAHKKHTVPNDRTSTALIFGNHERERQRVKVSLCSSVLTLSFPHWIVAKFRFFSLNNFIIEKLKYFFNRIHKSNKLIM